MKPVKIALIGECMVELQKKDEGIKQAFGGDTLNTALYLSRLTQDKNIQTSYVTALGSDPFSKQMLNAWQEEGINTELVMNIADKQPGLYYIETDETGERSFVYWRNDAAAKYLFDQPESAELFTQLMDFDAIYLSGITLAILTDSGREALFEFLPQFKAKGGQVIFDNNFRPKLWSSKLQAMSWYLKILKHTDIALLTFDDEQELYGDDNVEQCIARTAEVGVQEIIIKRGSKDCLVVEGSEMQFVSPTLVENVVDTTAAGDSFSGGFLASRMTGGNAQQAALAGHKLAGAVIQHQGAIIPASAMPSL